VLVFAPTRSGKGVGVVVPTLLAWPHSVLVHDLKGENWQLTAGTRKRMGQACLRFEPASPEPGLARFNPLAEVRLRTPHEIRDTHNIVRMILDPYGKGLPDHWERAGGAALTGFILHQLYEGCDPTLAGVDALLSDPERSSDQTLEYIMRAEHDPSASRGWRDSRGNPSRTHPVAARAMRSLLNKAEKERSAVISEITEFLAPYRDPVVAANTAASDFRIVDLMDHARPVSLYIVVALADQEMLTPLIRLMLSQILHRLTERLEYRDGRAIICHRRRLLLMLDEFATLGRLDMFARSLSLIAGYGIKACLITQDLTQIHEAYGQYESITSNCHTRLAFAPNKIETARLLSQMTGESTVRHSHRTVSSSGASVSEPEVARPLLTPDEAMRLGDNEALIFVNGRPAIRANKLRHYAGPFFKLIAKIRAPSISDRLITGSEPEPDDEQQPVPIIGSEKAVEPATEPSKRDDSCEGRQEASALRASVRAVVLSESPRRKGKRLSELYAGDRRQGATTVRRQVTAYMSDDEFTRLRDEADERGITLSRYIKERLFQTQGTGGLTFSDATLAAAEKRIIEVHRASITQSLKPIAQQLTTLLAMIDQFALSMLSHLPEIPEGQRKQALSSGQRRHRGWRTEVEETLKQMEGPMAVRKSAGARSGEAQ